MGQKQNTNQISPTSSVKFFLGKGLYKFFRTIIIAFSRLMLNMDIKRDALLPAGAKILAANHPTTLDPLYISSLFSDQVSILITAASFDIPILGSCLRATGQLRANRGSGGSTVDTIIHTVKSGRTVLIFPEGSLSPLSGGFNRPHTGVARVALSTGAPVIPIGIGLQRDRIRVTTKETEAETIIGHFYTGGPYFVTIGKPLHFEGSTDNHKHVCNVADQIMQRIQELSKESEDRMQLS